MKFCIEDGIIKFDSEKHFNEFCKMINVVPMSVIDDIKNEIETNIKCNTDSKGLVNLLGQGQMMALKVIDEHIRGYKK